MLINFTFENWLSFKNGNTFSMVANPDICHHRVLPCLASHKKELLPVAAIFGGNASGKSNFVGAIEFAREFVINGSQDDDLIPTKPFELDKTCKDKPSRFEFVLLIDENLYKYDFSLRSDEVLHEELKIVRKKNVKTIFERKNGNFKFNFGIESKREKIYSDLIYPNELFLTNSRSFNIKEILPVYKWFKDTLRIVRPVSKINGLHSELSIFHEEFDEMLFQLDTGINSLKVREVASETSQLPANLLASVQKTKRGTTGTLPVGDERYVFNHKENGDISFSKLVSSHRDNNNDEVEFNLYQESDGTKRIIDLLLKFFDMVTTNKVYVIDEINRSLHSILTKNLLEAFLSTCDKDFRSQLILTTHELHVMEQN